MKQGKINLKPQGTFLKVLMKNLVKKIHYTIKFKFRNWRNGGQELENAINHSESLNSVIFNYKIEQDKNDSHL